MASHIFFLLINCIPILCYLMYLLRFLCNKYTTYIYFFNIFFFFLFSIFFYIFFFLFFSLFFIFKIWRYFKFFKGLGHHVYFKKLSIFISFWQYIMVYIYKFLYTLVQYTIQLIYNRLKVILNFLFFNLLMYNFFFLFFRVITFDLFMTFYNISIIIRKLLYNAKIIEYYYIFYRFFLFLFQIKDIEDKYIDDPVLDRNKFFKLYTNLNYYINISINTNYYIEKKNICLRFFFFLLDKYVKVFLFRISNIKISINFIKIIYNDLLIIIVKLIKKHIIICVFLLYLLLLNLIYSIIKLSIYVFFFFFKYTIAWIKKSSFFLKILIILFIFFYFYWFITYFLLLLYKHYTLYLPLYNVKENFRFFDFEWIDLRNYFNLISLNNTLIDLNVHNNVLYNEVIKQLNFKLVKYNFKFTSNFNINLYLKTTYKQAKMSEETIILNNIFEKWNKYHGGNFIRRWKKYKRMLNWSLRNTFKGKDWYKAIRNEKLKSCQLPIFNSGRYFENTKTEIANNLGFWENMHFVKNLPYNKETKLQFQKTQAWYTYFKKRHTSKKKPRFILTNYIKLKHIPLNSMYIEFNKNFLNLLNIKRIKENKYFFELYLNKMKNLEKTIFFIRKFYYNWAYKFTNFNGREYYLKKYYKDFIEIQENFIYKNKIATLLVTEMRMNRLPSLIFEEDKHLNDYVSMALTDEMHQYVHYRDLSKKSCLKNVLYKTTYIYNKYPYKINNKNLYYQLVIKNYLNLLETGVKITKKYLFFDRSRLRNYNKLSHRLLVKIDTVYANQLLKYKYWEKVFYLNRLNNKNLDFWNFFDYLKVNRYTILKNNDNFTGNFIMHWKKDYYHMRIYLLRIITFLHYYNNYRKMKMNQNKLVFFDWLQNVKIDGNFINLENLSSLNSIKFMNDIERLTREKENANIMDQNTEQDQMSEALFSHFKLRWHFREILNPASIDSFGNKDKFMYLINLFYKKFNKYFIEYNKINKYNNEYIFKIKSYKIKVLRKIKNLKKFFYYNTKRNKGLRIFDYLNTLSIQYHIKHLLWHSPYSYLLFRKNNVFKNEKTNNLFFFAYSHNEVIYSAHDYSYIFNVLLNILDIKEEWSLYLTDLNGVNHIILNSTFYYTYNYGNFFFFYLNELEIFRIFIALLKNYYNSFLIKIIRYRYCIEKKNYSLITFFNRYLKQYYKSSYLKIRYFIYQTHETYVRYLKKKYLYFLRKKYWIRNRVTFIPFWFLFDYYIKCLIKFLFNKYYVKENFVFWWLNYRLNYPFLFMLYLFIQKYKYANTLFLNFYIKKFILSYIYFFKYFINIINMNNFVLIWYFKLIKNNILFLINLKYQINTFKYLYKFICLNYIYYFKNKIINSLNLILNLNNLLYFKFDLHNVLQYFIKYMQNIKNNLIYFKSNYYYFKKQKLIRKKKRNVPLFSLLSTNLKRNWFSLRNRSSNFFVFHNIYLLNLQTIYYIKSDMNTYNFYMMLISIFPFLKLKLLNLEITVLMLFFIYISFFLFIFIINKKFFRLFFIYNKFNISSIDFKIKLMENENTFNNLSNISKKKLFFYKFFLFNYKKKKNINVIDLFYNKKLLWFKKLFKLKNYLNYNSFDQFQKNKPLYKTNLFTTFFTKLNTLNNFIKNYKKFFLLKRMPLFNIFNDYLVFYEFNYKKENIIFNYKKITDSINLNFIFFYWFFIIPYFMFQYIITKYHLKMYTKTKRRIYYFFRTLLDNINFFVKINKYLGRSFLNNIYKSKRWKDPNHVFITKKRPKKSHFVLNNLRYRKLFYRLSPIGPYYYWFSRINIVQYVLSYRTFFFKTIYKSYYYFWFILIYFLILIYMKNKYYDIYFSYKLKLKNFNFKKST